MKPRPNFVGRGPDGEPIISGEFIFWMMDSQGVPLEVQLPILEEKGWGFSVPQFIEAAHASKNWSAEALYNKLSKAFTETYGDHQADYVKAKTLLYIEKVYSAD